MSEENVQGVLAACREEIGYVQYSRLSACSFALVLNSFLPLPFNEMLAKYNNSRTMFGYQAENRGVGITGGVDFVELDGPTVILHLKGRFWHQRPTVLARVGAYLMGRIPEIVDVTVEDEYELSDEANNAAI